MQYNAIGEVDIQPTASRAGKMLDALADYHPAVGRTDDGKTEVVITFDADHFDVAATTGVLILIRALGQLRHYSVMTTEEFDRRTDGLDDEAGDLISTAEAARRLGVSRQRVLQRIDEGTLRGKKVGRGYAIRADSLPG